MKELDLNFYLKNFLKNTNGNFLKENLLTAPLLQLLQLIA